MGARNLKWFRALFRACFAQALAIYKPYFPIRAASDETAIALILAALEQNQMEIMG